MLKIREARRILRTAGFLARPGKGSHEIWTHPTQPGRITLCGHDGDDLLQYQEARLRRIQRRAS